MDSMRASFAPTFHCFIRTARLFFFYSVLSLWALQSQAIDSPEAPVDAIQTASWYQFSGTAMGTETHLHIQAESAQQADLAWRKVSGILDAVDERFSPHKPTSELSRINARAYKQWLSISDEALKLIQSSLDMSRRSGGAFDITVGSVKSLYDFRASKRPSKEALSHELLAVDYHFIQLRHDSSEIRFTHPNTRIDLGGIAKGHAVDRSIEWLLANGFHNAMVSAGGDSRIVGDRDGRPWHTGIRNPRGDGTLLLIPLSESAVSTSGDYERFFVDPESGERHHHILQPNNGRSAGSVQSVSILAPTATLSDGLSTSVFVLGVEDGLRLINSISEADAIIIDASGLLHYSSGLLHAVE